MKNILKLFILSSILSLSSCEDFLEKIPLDTVSEAAFYRNASELQVAVNGFYNDLPGWPNTGVGFAILPDSNTDMLLTEDPSNRLSGLSYEVPAAASGSIWSWNEVREANWLIDHLDQASASSDTEQILIDQYSGEAYFFRAYYYFELFRRYGDLPIYPEYFDNNDTEFLFAARAPRNEVMDFILSDLDTAISLMQSFPDIPITPRISREAAQLFKARVALYEGTWEKYHNGTPFGVTGSDGTSYLQIAASAAEAVMNSGVFSLHSDYSTLFNQVGLSSNPEVMLWRDYDAIQFSSINNVLQISWPNRCGYTKFAVDSYLCTDGQPISVSPLFNDGDNESLATIENNRDPRLAALIMVPGDEVERRDGVITTVWEFPDWTDANTGNTGYESQKYRNINYEADFNNFTLNTSRIIMRYAEVLLIFAEAKAELGTITQSDLDRSINLLRNRVGMPGITLGNITTDPNWPNYGHTLTPIIYEVRRERSVELMAEGFRGDDLNRWRAHILFDGDQPRGAFYNDGIVNTLPNTSALDADGFLLPFAAFGNFNFDESRAYLQPIPLDQLQLNNNLKQNPGWE